MAEIKSTMDLVMERAARMGKASSEDLRQEEAKKKGIQLAVGFMEGSTEDLLSEINSQGQGEQLYVLQGATETLMRNIFLPREEVQQERTAKAVEGLKTLNGSLKAICDEITNVLGGYLQHREQLRSQLEEQVKMQYEALMNQQSGAQQDMSFQHKIQEEWNRVESELNGQYGKALDQLKLQISQRLGLA